MSWVTFVFATKTTSLLGISLMFLFSPVNTIAHSSLLGNALFRQGVADDNVKDNTAAFLLCRKVAEAGNPTAMNNMGGMYQDGRGVAKYQAEAVRLYSKAASTGDTQGMSNLGRMYAYGNGIAKDEAEAMRWYRKAAVAGNASAKASLERLNK